MTEATEGGVVDGGDGAGAGTCHSSSCVNSAAVLASNASAAAKGPGETDIGPAARRIGAVVTTGLAAGAATCSLLESVPNTCGGARRTGTAAVVAGVRTPVAGAGAGAGTVHAISASRSAAVFFSSATAAASGPGAKEVLGAAAAAVYTAA